MHSLVRWCCFDVFLSLACLLIFPLQTKQYVVEVTRLRFVDVFVKRRNLLCQELELKELCAPGLGRCVGRSCEMSSFCHSVLMEGK